MNRQQSVLALVAGGWQYHRAGKLVEAAQLYRQALALSPNHSLANHRLGLVAHVEGRLDEAERLIRLAIANEPTNAIFHYTLGIVLFDAGKLAEAEAAYRAALTIKADFAEAHFNLGSSLRRMGRLAESVEAYTSALASRPGYLAAERERAATSVQIESAQADMAPAPAVPHAAADLAQAIHNQLALPIVHADIESVAIARQRFAAGLARLEEDLPGFLAEPAEQLCRAVERVNFHLAYQGEDDRSLQERYGRLVDRILRAAVPDLMESPAPRAAGGARIRIGIASFFFWRTTVASYFQSWIAGLDRRRFEVYAYHLGPRTDQVTRQIQASADVFRHLDDAVSECARKIRQDALDIVVFPEVGMSGRGFLLAAMRLAPVQCAGWGHPVTTGLSTIDHFISCAEMEPADGAEHYSESLLLLPGIGTCYERPQPSPQADKALLSVGLAKDRRSYLVPQSLFKIHPDNDKIFAEILSRDAKAEIVMFQSQRESDNTIFRNRLQRPFAEFGVALDRVRFLPFLTHDEYLRVNEAASVMIDCLHWSGGNTTLDAIASGLPVVTLPGRFMRGRQSQAILKRLGLADLIVDTPAALAHAAIAVAGDRQRREQISGRIRQGWQEVFARPEPVAALADALESVFNQTR